MTDLIFINPETKITIKGKDYTAKGTIGFINALQKHFNLPFARIAEKLDKGEMYLDDLCNIIRHGIEGGAEKAPSTDEVSEYIVDHVGIANARYLLSWFMQACVMPLEARGKFLEAQRGAMLEMRETIQNLEKNGTPASSPSESIAASA